MRAILRMMPRACASRRALPKAAVFPRLPAGTTIQSGGSQPRCCSSSRTMVFCPSRRQGVVELRRGNPGVLEGAGRVLSFVFQGQVLEARVTSHRLAAVERGVALGMGDGIEAAGQEKLAESPDPAPLRHRVVPPAPVEAGAEGGTGGLR